MNIWLLQVFATPELALKSPLYAQLMSPSRLVYSGNTAQLKGAPSYGWFYSDETTETAQLLLGHARLGADKNTARNLAVGLVNLNTSGWYNTATMMSVAQGLTAVPLTVPRGQGLAVEKELHNITRESGYQAGDVIEVTLKIHSSTDVNNIAMLDPIPAGSNILSEAYGYYSSGQKSYSGYKFYFERLSSGVTTVKYQYQLNNPGTFKLPPTRAEGLYTPSIFGEVPNTALTVK